MSREHTPAEVHMLDALSDLMAAIGEIEPLVLKQGAALFILKQLELLAQCKFDHEKYEAMVEKGPPGHAPSN
jgi:hypothetical protein